MRVVLDTNILVRAAKPTPNPARAVLQLVCADPHVLIISPHLISELERVLRYPRVRAQHQRSDEEIREFVAELEATAVMVPMDEGGAAESVTADPDDDLIVQTAALGKADVLCTLDRHLHAPATRAYCSRHGIDVRSDVELLEQLRQVH